MLSIDVKTGGNPEQLKGLPKKLQTALTHARKDTVKRLATYASRLAAEQNYITKSEVHKAIHPTAEGFHVRSTMRPLDKFKISPKSPRKRGYQLMAAVRRNGGLKPLGRGKFLLSLHGKWRAFGRKGAERYPIDMLYGPSIPQLVGNEENMPLIEQRASELWEERANYWTAKLMGVK